MGDLTSAQMWGVVAGGGLGLLVNYLSEIYVEPFTSQDPYPGLVQEITYINQDFQNYRPFSFFYSKFNIAGWDVVQAVAPFVVKMFDSSLVGSAFAVAWATQYVLEPWATPRVQNYFEKIY